MTCGSTAVARVDVGGRTVETDLQLVVAPVDRRRVEHAVEALLDNVARHTPEAVSVRVTVSADGGEVARIVVEDDGPGVAASVAKHVFEPFTQGPDSKDIANPGVGLGLAMVRVSARLHGGDARLEEVLPHGARFVVELPVARADDAAGAGAAAAPRAARTGAAE